MVSESNTWFRGHVVRSRGLNLRKSIFRSVRDDIKMVSQMVIYLLSGRGGRTRTVWFKLHIFAFGGGSTPFLCSSVWRYWSLRFWEEVM